MSVQNSQTLRKLKGSVPGMVKFWFAFVLTIAFPIFIIGCGETGGGAAIEPLANEPMILDSVMCISVSNDRPDGITDTFYSEDDRIYVWTYWTNLEDGSTIKVAWIKPDEDIAFREDSQLITTDSGFGIAYFYIEKPLGGFVEGEWILEIYVDDAFERSHLFTVE